MKYDATYNSKAFCNSLIPITTFAEVFHNNYFFFFSQYYSMCHGGYGRTGRPARSRP